jgi:hypothetical protein
MLNSSFILTSIFLYHILARYYPRLELEYDREHRARLIENGLEVMPEHILFLDHCNTKVVMTHC